MCRYDSHSGGEREIQRTMLELLNQLDGFDSKGDVKVYTCIGTYNYVCMVMKLSSIQEEYMYVIIHPDDAQ